MASVKVKFRPSTVNGKEGTLHYQIIHRRKIRQVHTGYKLFPYEWSSSLGIIQVSAGCDEDRREYLSTVKRHMDDDLLRIRKCICRLEQNHASFEVGQIVALYVTPVSEITFLSFTEELLADLTCSGKVRTAATYRTAIRGFVRFLNERMDIPLNELDSNLMVQYESWMKERGICPNTSSFYLRNLRAIYNRAVDQGLVVVQQNPFKHVYTGIEKTQKRAIPLKMIRKIRDLELKNESQAFARDIFLFSFYTRGMSFVDMAYLKKKDLRNGILSYRRNKTHQQLFIKWEKPMQELVDKYDTGDSPYLLPIIREAGVDERRQYLNEVHRINRNLKLIGEQIGLSIPLTTYVARHSWASIAHSKNVSLSVISEALGHDSEKTTRIYLASLDTSLVDKANSLILNSLL